jgi:energy-coupling factor transporter ATP-binding protein EcfA2
MRTLARIAAQGHQSGKALPRTLAALDRLDVSIRESEITVIAGNPGSGKSALALTIARMMGVPTFYYSPDSSDGTQMMRALSMATGLTQKEVERHAADDPQWAADTLRGLDIWWSFASGPSLNDIADDALAYYELNGDFPKLFIVDSLYDVDDGSEGESAWFGLLNTLKDLKKRAKETGAAFIVLHHTSEQAKYEVCPPRSALQGKPAAVPETILTLANDPSSGILSIACVKNRHGEAHEDGTRPEYVFFDAQRMAITDVGDR